MSQQSPELSVLLPLVSVIVPCRNEAHNLPRSLGALLAQDYPTERLEIIVVDGVSEDGSAEVARAILSGAPHKWSVVRNPDRNTPAALNLGLKTTRGDVVLHLIAHGEIAPNYVRRAVAMLEQTGADCVGGPMETRGETTVGQAIALALSSAFGVGGVAYRSRPGHSGFVDTVLFGVYRRAVFDHVGPYDPAFIRNQDAELNFRITRSGGRIWLDSSLQAVYWCRETFGALWRQHFGTGKWKPHLFAKHGRMPAWRHYVPGLFVASVVALTVVAAFGRPQFVLAVLGLYSAILLATSAWAARRHVRLWPLVAVAMLTLHFSYGFGSLVGAWQVMRLGKPQPRPNTAEDSGRASRHL